MYRRMHRWSVGRTLQTKILAVHLPSTGVTDAEGAYLFMAPENYVCACFQTYVHIFSVLLLLLSSLSLAIVVFCELQRLESKQQQQQVNANIRELYTVSSEKRLRFRGEKQANSSSCFQIHYLVVAALCSFEHKYQRVLEYSEVETPFFYYEFKESKPPGVWSTE